jgi:hypothetical protein
MYWLLLKDITTTATTSSATTSSGMSQPKELTKNMEQKNNSVLEKIAVTGVRRDLQNTTLAMEWHHGIAL